ncbi:RNA-binding S4 domain-containing protein [Ferribacterium limneticum]|uniref:RNA-binding S4 domain-containing protein n=1 Tax=Ferribacterium limneticum TaxID=76259 RepID=UPI001CFB5F36|nr:RNA-binding S4 domain-containing protein [Ferribacterium limneticum]UCV30361.1 RNA-binding S4 domain-containing protein [Ferribacterium limneticum]UCV34279.1 RNA-binding S4 domain-containing protein [Ferribacterium limneticum]
MRVDKWLWAARFFKTRSLASDAVSGGKVKINRATIKPAREIKIGDQLEIANSETRWEVTVKALSDKRGPAPEARMLYEETPESIAAREAERESRQFVQDPAADTHGRPTKRDRRQLGRFSGS